MELALDPVQVIGVLGADADLDQATLRSVRQLELLPAVGSSERVPAQWGETEVGVVGGSLLDVRDADGDRGESVQGHGVQSLLTVRD